jgi:hypothetical protein
MKAQALDLARSFPRSPKEKLGAHVMLARMADKARAKAAGSLGEYKYPCPLDESLLEFLEIQSDAFFQAAQAHTDDELLKWVKANAMPQSAKEIEVWNTAFMNRKPESPESLEAFLKIRKRVAPGRKDVTAWVDLLDLEEGRPVPERGPTR